MKEINLKSRNIRLVPGVCLVAVGAALTIFGAAYTVTACNWSSGSVYTLPAGIVFRGFYPIWNPPVRNTALVCGNWTPAPSSVDYTVNYTVNYAGAVVLIMAAVLTAFAFWTKELKPSRGNIAARITQ